jgi:periplasmic protein TonB
MKTENSVSKSWDDLVFENRNHDYGAYAIRKSYTDNVLSGAFFSIAIGALVLLIPFLSSFMRGEDAPLIPNIPLEDLTNIFIQPPPIELIPPTVVAPASPAAIRNLPPQVTTQPTDVVLPTNAELTASLPGIADTEGSVPTGESIVAPAELPVVVEPPSVFSIAEVMPVYEGGLKAMYEFIQKKMRYPSVAQRNDVQGTVYVSFVVNASGKVVDVGIVKGVSSDLDKEAVRVIAMMPGWKAGKQHDKNVSVRMTLPIKFKINQ